MILKIFFQISSLITFSYCQLGYPKCNGINNNATILSSLNGKVQGACYNVTLDYGGNKSNINKNVLTWLGVPYAQPPIGTLRFRNPVPVQTWANTRNGINWSSACTQMDDSGISPFSSEDCLYLNIFVPYDVYQRAVIQNDATSRVPVYVWIHGGAMITGASYDFDSSNLVSMTGMIVVTINYRLGPFGYLTVLNTDAKGNQGFLDQSLALKWVFDNANLFGGDKAKITIGGESAGSWSVGLHLLYKPSWPYFSKAIMQSGSPIDLSSNLATPQVAHIFAAVAGSRLKCNIANSQALFDCLQSKSTSSFMLATNDYFYEYADIFLMVTYDPNIFSQQPRRLIETGDFKRCDILIGTNNYEFLMFLPRVNTPMNKLRQNLMKNPGSLPFNYTKYYQTYNLNSQIGFYNKIIDLYGLTSKNVNLDFYGDNVAMLTDQQYRCPTYLFAEFYSKYNQTSYVYMYGHKASYVLNQPEDGAQHAAEIDFVFGRPLAQDSSYPVSERIFTDQLVNFWASFIKNNNPNPPNSGLPVWPQFKTDTSSLRNVYFLKAQNIANTNYNVSDPKCAFWNL